MTTKIAKGQKIQAKSENSTEELTEAKRTQ